MARAINVTPIMTPCIECPLCGSQEFRALLEPDLETLKLLECAGFDIFGNECKYAIGFDDDDD